MGPPPVEPCGLGELGGGGAGASGGAEGLEHLPDLGSQGWWGCLVRVGMFNAWNIRGQSVPALVAGPLARLGAGPHPLQQQRLGRGLVGEPGLEPLQAAHGVLPGARASARVQAGHAVADVQLGLDHRAPPRALRVAARRVVQDGDSDPRVRQLPAGPQRLEQGVVVVRAHPLAEGVDDEAVVAPLRAQGPRRLHHGRPLRLPELAVWPHHRLVDVGGVDHLEQGPGRAPGGEVAQPEPVQAAPRVDVEAPPLQRRRQGLPTHLGEEEHPPRPRRLQPAEGLPVQGRPQGAPHHLGLAHPGGADQHGQQAGAVQRLGVPPRGLVGRRGHPLGAHRLEAHRRRRCSVFGVRPLIPPPPRANNAPGQRGAQGEDGQAPGQRAGEGQQQQGQGDHHRAPGDPPRRPQEPPTQAQGVGQHPAQGVGHGQQDGHGDRPPQRPTGPPAPPRRRRPTGPRRGPGRAPPSRPGCSSRR